ncbi:midasin [Massarina eburnea CBS 473.64]|uniref:Midasin n=1 Tax=Massarina eburnea CBS 473.64 TaxID=1395130 RepID=A0A6A6RL77_9PLEO|nr:midasin [Massarina eburnea CBS 473.64]
MVSFESLATDALDGQRTDGLFVLNEKLFVEVAARWIQSGVESERKVAAFGRLLPLAPHLAEHVDRFLASTSQSSILGPQTSNLSAHGLRTLKEADTCQLLLGTFRLLSFDCRSFAKYVRPVALESLFHHSSAYVRYLAIRTFALYVHAADHATQELIKKWVGEAEVQGGWEGQSIDYRFLSLWEEKRWKDLRSRLQTSRTEETGPLPLATFQHLSPSTVGVAGILLPRLDGAPSHEKPSELVPTSTTESNLTKIASGLLHSSPLLLTGLAGSGKTLLTRYFAWQLNKLDSMVTLHLNEQSDAKLLVGMYATGAKPGTFSWRPGVLTTAVKEGRWIFIEDLDRAPNEVISTFLPLIERGELLIPNRGETVRAARGFRIIATMRSTLNPAGQQIVPRQNMIGLRFWNPITVQMPELSELEKIISVKYPKLRKHVAGIMRTYARLLELYSDAKFSSENGTSLRALTPRDLLKWCDRIAVLLEQSSSFSVAQMDDIFMEAYDCFAGSLRSEQSRARVMAYVAEELHIDPQRRDHLLQGREVKLEMPPKSSSSGTIRIGRMRLSRHRISKRHTSGRPFSTNDYTLRLLEKIAVAVNRQEPLLLVGETGTGKTTCIQYLAEQLGRKMVAFNLSQQSESGDLLGGYKPVNVRSLVIPLKDEFDNLFDTTFSRKKNQRFIEMLGKRVAKGEWKRVCTLWREALKMVDAARKAHESHTLSPDPDGGQPKKKRKVESLPVNFPGARWEKFAADLHDLEAQLANGSEAFAFSFLEGNIVKAVRNGDWVLLDEINLASSDTLEALADLLGSGPDGTPSILLTETGNVERVVAHPNFRVFAAMNPATDVGKKDLPPGIRSRFTELYVESPDGDRKSLQNIVEKYLGGDSHDPAIVKIASDVTKLYLKIQELAKANMLVDGADQKAHFSLRTLTRTLSYAREIAPSCSLRRALFEGFHMSFLTFLGRASEDLVAPLIKEHLFPQKAVLKAELGKPLQQPTDGRVYVRQGHYWLRQGTFAVEEQLHYIITPFVQRNMNNLIRAASTRRYPVLIQGPTSSGKTSMIEYLAKRSGNKFVRINNHEHTDLQEYLGSYISGSDGKLTFQEGILVKALREGHWIVLDELNLAPTDVLEALNRLLDDNRELLIPETQEVIRPHEDFMLFATQNPAGLYGGRKVLSRAFRNRFLELHFDDIPVEELTEILHRRTMIPESWCKRIVSVYQELSTLRQENRLFEQKSFATLRDLFRWAQRKADTIQDLANNGYMLLAERVRKEDERIAVKTVIENVMSKKGPRVTIDEESMWSDASSPEIKLCKDKARDDASVVWTRAMRRLFVLVAHAIRNNEPVLLVGETGCGKTTVCQMLADAFEKQLHILNAHQNTETGDLIGAQRPMRNRAATEELLYRQVLSVLRALPDSPNIAIQDLPQLLDLYDSLDETMRNLIPFEHREEIQTSRIRAAALFEWADGSLVHAMKTGQYFLLDEISLADDSVLERLNSVLESSRTLLLAEKGPMDSLVMANEGFQFLATMNPGGDYGKKELSPALRNRFTEIWVPALSDVEDILQIVRSKLKPSAVHHASSIVSFAQWFNEKYNTSVVASISIRDTLAWVTFINNSPSEDPLFGIVHGAAMVFVDTLGANPAGLLTISSASIDEERKACLHQLSNLLDTDVSPLYFNAISIVSTPETFQLGAFSIPKFTQTTETDLNFSLEAPTTRSNAMRIVRALQLSKPILLEGNPGVGKTTLITALAKAVGKPLTRLNLSEQTDLMDLFGSDVPVEGGQAGTFAWRDAPFLKSMKKGDWVLLDEMNLASQSVLEGLNAVLDHRGEVFISELDQTFHKHADFRVFAAQNPHHQGGGRKGLPASFVNRFTVVYADVFHPQDLSLICSKVFPSIEDDEVRKLISFVAQLDEQVVDRRAFGSLGAPWEFNLRDTLRWLQLVSGSFSGSARDFLGVVFAQRFRTEADRSRVLSLFETVHGAYEPRITLYHDQSTKAVQVGLGTLTRNLLLTRAEHVPSLRIQQLAPMEALLVSVRQNWPVILVGSPGSGKTSILTQLASTVGASLVTFSMNADIDAMDLVGGYEQVDPSRELYRFLEQLDEFVRHKLVSVETPPASLLTLLEQLSDQPKLQASDLLPLLQTLATEDQDFAAIFQQLQQHLQTPQQIDGARFQWVDGILIQALEQGKWLVLDNANLCSSAVLDRLNSLLEPNGYLSINEHSTADGEARIVKPHQDFRIFMTMDPRFGELSRAMRNRAVEICLIPEAGEYKEDRVRTPEYPLDSAMYRFRHLCKTHDCEADGVVEKIGNLSFADNSLLRSFKDQLWKGLLSPDTGGQTISMAPSSLQIDGTSTNQNRFESICAHIEYLLNDWIPQAETLQRQLIAPGPYHLSFPYHHLNNELSLRRSASTRHLSLWYASLYDVVLDLHKMKQAIKDLPSTRLERRKEKQKLPAFLQAFWKGLKQSIEAILAPSQSSQLLDNDMSDTKALRQLFWVFLELASSSSFDRATFQTYLKMLASASYSTAKKSSKHSQALTHSLSKEVATFGSDVQLTTGLGMEYIWRAFKPVTSSTLKQLTTVLALERLADRLDAVMWKSRLRLDEMIQIRERFGSSLELVRRQDVDAEELVTNLGVAVSELEQSIGEDDVAITPYFEEEFEGLCQFLDVAESLVSTSNVVSLVRAKSSLLARRSTKCPAIEDGKDAGHFVRLYRYLGHDKPSKQEIVLKGCFHTAMLSKLLRADEVQLVQLDRFESELQVLSQQLILDTVQITQDQNNVLRTFYRSILSGLSASHCSDVIEKVDQDTLSLYPDASISVQHHRALLPLQQCYKHANTVNQVDAQAWITLALTGLALYVPNYPHDPALRPMIERRLFNEEKSSLVAKLQALRGFQISFTGQDTSFRICQTEEMIQAMGDEPPVPTIVRPVSSELDSLQGEFSNLLSIIQPLASGSISIQEASNDHTLRQNIAHVIRRLEEGYRSYDDITAPALGFLVCLNIGLTLGAKGQEGDSEIARSLTYIAHQTPFLGLHTRHNVTSSDTLLKSCDEELGLKHAIDLRWHAVYCLATTKTVDPSYLGRENTRQLLHNLFSSFYGDWKNKLLQDQQEEAKNTNLYTFRGEEEADEEDPTLFPDYEKEDETQPLASTTSREHVIRLANIHADIFLGGGNASDAIKALLEWCEAHGSNYENALPLIYLSLQKKAHALSTSGASKEYNFYFDANLTEAKRLITLIHRIQLRYREIRKVWPEHVTLWDFRHVDPVAKFITKVEKLYGYIAAALWRQLELTTWARLFDIETEKARDNAKSWFFVAYETIIAAAESIEDETSMKTHTKDLLKTMEGFFLSTTLGQYEQRIALLRQLQHHIAMRVQDNNSLTPVYLALGNFIAYFSRLQKPKLEKEINDVIKLASWKDTNIEALKQSAKTSHRKLSKLVRKFRAILNQPVSGIVKAGFPEEDTGTAINPQVLACCTASIPSWSLVPTRFKNLSVTVSMMRNLSSPNTEAVDGATYISNFIVELEASIIELQKATPNLLNDENKETLYADTMKELRQMGIKSNLSSDVLARQDELSTVLATLPKVDEGGREAEFFLHKSLEHSGDLTPNDVARSVGYLEGLLHATVRQRVMLTLCVADEQAFTKIEDEQANAATTLQSSLSWLGAMLDTGADVVDAQAKLGMTGEVDELVRDMREWSLPNLPTNICLHGMFESWIERYPISQTVLNHIQPYVFNYPQIQVTDMAQDERVTVETHSKDIFTALDLILGSMQDVEAALKDLPSSIDDATWLICDAVNVILDRMHLLYTNDNLHSIAALITAMQPIFKQYLASHKYLLLHRLSKSFIQSADQPGKDDKLESGTGLGEGEGAEDISKDIGDDEDLEELAQEQKGEREGSIEEEDDAVDMAAEKEDQGSDAEEGDDDVQSEVGSVDDLGPRGKEDDLKEREGKEDVGTENQDEQNGENKEKEDQEAGKEEEDEEMEETEKMDPHAKEEETLDLPDDLNMDGDDGEDKDDNLGDMNMDAGAEPDMMDEEIGPEQENEEEKDTTGHQQEDEGPVDDDTDEARESRDDNADPNAEAGAGAEANEEAHQNQKEQTSASAANREDGNEGDSSEKQQETTAEDGTLGQTAQPDAGGRSEQQEDSPETQSFKKLGDVLEKWYNQQKEISEAQEKNETQAQQIDKDVDMAKADFEHLADEETKADTQALGTATEEQATTLDHDMAMAVDEEETAPMRPEDKDEEAQNGEQQDVDMEDAAPPQDQDPPPQSTTEGQPQSFIGEQKPFSRDDDDDAEMENAVPVEDNISDTSSIADVDTQLELTHLGPSSAPTVEQARALWHAHESATHSLSLQLTESLRLILAPTLATKLRGDFRTGKRLNLKRIIPYIASGYKRDKIWLRRSMPSKRSYQVLIALDDSRSMAEGGVVEMGLKTLTLVTRSLAMLEVGEVGVVGFGDNVNVAHEFDKPFTSEAGVKVFEQFGFAASKTNVRGLVERSLELFKEARAKASSSVSEDLWQLMLVVSDGICDSHTEIQRLVRRAQEERVMIVFVIIDATATNPPPSAVPATVSDAEHVIEQPKEKTSIMDLTSVDISPEGKIVKWKYMEKFPFRYYFVVRDVRELPGVLSAALRQWFGEVAGSV